MSSEIIRSTFGPFGTAIRYANNSDEYLAWAVHGQTTGESPLDEIGETWAAFGDSADQAMLKLITELRGMMQ